MFRTLLKLTTLAEVSRCPGGSVCTLAEFWFYLASGALPYSKQGGNLLHLRDHPWKWQRGCPQ